MPIPQPRQETEFSALLMRHHTILNRLCLRYCGGDAFYFDELRQECALELWEEFCRYGLRRSRGESEESTWIYKICIHAISHYMRNPNHNEFQSVDRLLDTEYSDSRDDDWSQLDEITERLNNRERTLLAHYLSGEPYSTIARTEGITESNARQRMSRLLKKLKMLVKNTHHP